MGRPIVLGPDDVREFPDAPPVLIRATDTKNP
jgi:hypothetical protein